MSQVAGGQAIFEEKYVFVPFLSERKYKMWTKSGITFNLVTFLMSRRKKIQFPPFLSNSTFW